MSDNRALLENALRTIQDLRARLALAERATSEPIAIIGMGCRFPGGADTPEAFWNLLREGVDTVTEIPRSRWDIAAYYDPNPDAAGKTYVRAGSFLRDIDQFDAQFFGIAPLEAASIDPQQRLFLEVCWEALENAGIAPSQLNDSQTGVFVGAFWDDYSALRLYADAPDQIDAYRLMSCLRGFAAGRLAFTLGLHGPAMQVDTACSSSLLAAHLACQSLRNRECDLALAGGVFLIVSPQEAIGLCRMRAISPDGRCKTFDAKADGFGRGEGCGVVLLKRLPDAIRDNDNILALIRGSAVNHDGASNGITAPNGLAQEALLRQALKNAAVSPDRIQFVEAHGTGTPLGDPIEVLALANVLGQRRTTPLMLGSVKTNIGHLAPAAGVAALTKTVLALQHREIPATLNFSEPNPHIPWQDLPIVVPTAPTPWVAESPRMAGVSAFGLTGTNVHLIVEEAPSRDWGNHKGLPLQGTVERPCHLLTLSAKSEDALRALAGRYETFLATHPQESLADICFTANTGRSHFPNRLALVAESREQLRQRLTAFASGQESGSIVAGQVSARKRPKIAFLFSGQGAQHAGMGRQLYETQPSFRKTINRCDEISRQYVDKPLLEILYGADAAQSERWLDEATYAQPALFALEYALAELWRSLGIEPDIVIGHSMGEYIAACVAGVVSLEDGLKLIAARGRLIQTRSEEGQMVAVLAEEARVRKVLEPFAADVSVAVINSPQSVVISGRRQAVQAATGALRAAGIETRALKIVVASHSPLMEPVLEEFEQIVRSVAHTTPRVKVVSNLTGQVADEVLTTPEYWRRHLREPVRFAAGMQTLERLGIDTFIEIGPQPTLLVLGQQCLPNANDKAWLPSLRRKGEDWQQMLASLAALYGRGASVDWAGFDRDYVRRKVVLPTYPFQRKRYWVELDENRARQAAAKNDVLHPLLHRQIHSAAFQHGEIAFESKIGLKTHEYLADHRVYDQAILPATAYMEMALAAGAVVFKNSGCAVENVSIQQAMTLPDDDAAETTVQMILTPTETGYRWEVFSRADDDSAWTLHATGNVAPMSLRAVFAKQSPIRSLEIASVQKPPLAMTEDYDAQSLSDLQARCQKELDIASHYQQSREEGIEYGPAFQGLEKLFRADGEALGHIRLPESLLAQARAYNLHPALLDACLQVGGSIFPNEPGQVYLPTGLERLMLFENGGGHTRLQCYAKVNRQKAKGESQESATGRHSMQIDFELFDEQGKPVARLEGLSLWSVSRQALLGSRAVADWLYRVDWQPSQRAERSPYAGMPGSWLILADRGGIGAALAARLEEKGEYCTVISSQPPTSEFQIPNSNWRGVVYLWGLDANGNSTQDVPDIVRDLYSQVLHLAQALIQSGTNPRLWLVTQGAVAVGQVANLSHAPLWGLGRTIPWEHPELQCTCVDLDDTAQAEHLLEELWFADAENQIALRGGARHVARLVRHHETDKHPLPINAESCYLITGGLGGLGLHVAKWLVAQGARYLTLVGRSGASESAAQVIAELKRAGATLQVVRGDVAKCDDAVRMLAASQMLAPLRGIVHAAGVIDDGILLQQTVERFEGVMAPKVQGSWYLHTLSEHLPLDFFVCFSSVASLLGNGGQANYAAASAFEDALAHYRRARGLPGLTINWGAWAEVGLAAEMARRAEVEALSPEQGVQALGALMQGTAPQVGVLPVTWSRFQRQLAGREMPLLAEMLRPVARKKTAASLKQQLAAAAQSERYALLKQHVQDEVNNIVGVRPDDQQVFTELGMTSLMAIQLANRLAANLGARLPATTVLEQPTIARLTDYLAETMWDGHKGGTTAEGGMTPPLPLIDPRPVSRDRDIPLSLAQMQAWQRLQTDPNMRARNLAFHYRLDGKLNVAALCASVDEMVRRHEILRTAFAMVNDCPAQAIAPALTVNWSLTDLRNLSEREQAQQITRLVKEDAQRPFDFVTAPLLRATLIQLGEASFVLGLVFHHIILDVASADILMKELGLIYDAFVAGKPSPLPEPTLQYADFAYWQQQTLTPDVLDARRNYWQQWLADEPPQLKLSIDQPRSTAATLQVGSERAQIPPDLTQKLESLSQQSGATLFATMLAAFAVLLNRYGGGEEIVIGVPFGGRNHHLLESSIGLFATGTFPLKIDLRGRPSFGELLARAQRTHLAALANGDVPLEPLVRTLQPERNLRDAPLARVMLNWLPEGMGDNLKLAGVAVTPLPMEGMIGRDLILNVWKENTSSGSALRAVWRYRGDLFAPEAIVKMADDFRSLLEQIVTNPEQEVL